ncbi:hypothetical protein HYP58_gp80 [Vibrio phage 1.097.O._10N.286.49.B3]|uniref:Uncharacterized protein n=1 Tax=Vibrio phage 1.097.O._10N.286.49.B3 TaxID=1881383 RepID=A0A2I7R0P5_9CAUD|nr:hypothetical protein HYP58_gp80 [Vibrio phage 1.097.O._10N.286.49.B3]AUR87226.1 hypothetical protein NVP1097O_80 [Vibrio phage 1.097.O._10N.286.49.B3]
MFKIYQSKTQASMYLILEVAPPTRAWVVSNERSVQLDKKHHVDTPDMSNLLCVESTYREALSYIKMHLLMEDL